MFVFFFEKIMTLKPKNHKSDTCVNLNTWTQMRGGSIESCSVLDEKRKCRIRLHCRRHKAPNQRRGAQWFHRYSLWRPFPAFPYLAPGPCSICSISTVPHPQPGESLCSSTGCLPLGAQQMADAPFPTTLRARACARRQRTPRGTTAWHLKPPRLAVWNGVFPAYCTYSSNYSYFILCLSFIYLAL